MEIKEIQITIEKLKEIYTLFFLSAEKVCGNKKDDSIWTTGTLDEEMYWNKLPEELQAKSQEAQKMTLEVISLILPALQSSPILDKSDEKDIGIYAKKMRSALKLKEYKSWEIDVLHDEGVVLGVNPPGQSENKPFHPTDANKVYSHCLDKLEGMLQLIKVAPIQFSNGLVPQNPNLNQAYKPDTAFIMMPIDPNNPKLDDVYDAYKDCFSRFSITAVRANDIEHEGVITQRIIEEIKTSEFLVGDLTNARPSVYYEIGYAHSLGRRVILYRKKNTSVHFDLAGYNCPEYKNMQELKTILLKRLEVVTNRKFKDCH